MSQIYFDAYTRFGPRQGQHFHQRWTLDHLLKEMAHCSISGALVTHTTCVTTDLMTANRNLSEQLQPHDHLFPLWNIMPHWTGEVPEPAELTRIMRDHDVRAVTLYPASNGWELMSRSSAPLLKELAANQTLTIFDAGDGVSLLDIENLAHAYPDLPILLRNTWWNRTRAVTPLLLACPNVHLCFDSFQVNLAVEWFCERGCEDQLLFASNAVDMSMGAHRLYIDYAAITQAQKDKIRSGNLTRLLKGQGPKKAIENGSEDEIMAAARRGEPLPGGVIDFHAHMLEEHQDGIGGQYTMWRGGPGGVRMLADRLGVDAIGMMSWIGPCSICADDGNRVVTAALDALPPTYWGLGTFDIIHDTPDQQLAKMEALYSDPRYLGLKPYPRYGKHYDDPAYAHWWEFGSRRRLYAGLHPNRNDLSEFDKLCPKYPDMTFVAYHCGGSWNVADAAIDKARKYPNFYAEITLTPSHGGIIDHLARGCGADRVLYGSDLPMRDPRQQLGWVVYSRLSLEDKRLILRGNAERILSAIRRHNGYPDPQPAAAEK